MWLSCGGTRGLQWLDRKFLWNAGGSKNKPDPFQSGEQHEPFRKFQALPECHLIGLLWALLIEAGCFSQAPCANDRGCLQVPPEEIHVRRAHYGVSGYSLSLLQGPAGILNLVPFFSNLSSLQPTRSPLEIFLNDPSLWRYNEFSPKIALNSTFFFFSPPWGSSFLSCKKK